LTILLLTLTVISITAQNILKKQFSLRCSSGVYIFNALSAIAATLFFAVIVERWEVNAALLFYSTAFALSYIVACAFMILAIRHGSLARTTLILSYSLLIPMIYGMIFWDEPLTSTKIIGSVLLIVSLFLANYEKSNKAFSLKWLIYVVLAFIGNGMCSVTQRIGQNACHNGNMLMVTALIIVTIFFLLSGIIREKGPVASETVKKGWHLALACGFLNGLANFLVIILNGKMSASVLFPVIAAGGLAATFIVSAMAYKETFNFRQTLGFIAGLGSIVLLNL
jgi:drug/metabolite transporter (DMT)-like permease